MSFSNDRSSPSPMLLFAGAVGLIILAGALLWFWSAPGDVEDSGAETAAADASQAPATQGSAGPTGPPPDQAYTLDAWEEKIYLPEVQPGRTYDFWEWGTEPRPFGTLQVVDREGNMLKLKTADGLEFWKKANDLNISGETKSHPQDSTHFLRRTVARSVINGARIIEAATDQWAIENYKVNEDSATWEQISPFIKETSLLYQMKGKDPLEREYIRGDVAFGVQVDAESVKTFRDVTNRDYWGSYAPEGVFEEDPQPETESPETP